MAQFIVEVVEGPDAGKSCPVNGALEIGREVHGLVLDDEMASRRHARVTMVDGSCFVEDLGSRNGTVVNGEELHGASRIEAGDQLLIGVSVLQLRSQDQVRAQATVTRPVPEALAVPPREPAFVPRDVALEPLRQPSLDRLLDTRVKTRARTAPIGMLVLAALAVMLYLANR
jgi:predicted component of type VI protein secretion system